MYFEKIKEYCDQKGISIADLAKRIGISKPGLYRSIQEKSMKVDTLEKISQALGVPIWNFFGLDPETPYVKEMEQIKNHAKINEETLAQMSIVINELKTKIRNVQTAIVHLQSHKMFTEGKWITKTEYEYLLQLFTEYVLKDFSESSFELFQDYNNTVMYTLSLRGKEQIKETKKRIQRELEDLHSDNGRESFGTITNEQNATIRRQPSRTKKKP